jgi:hypothetical protein
VSDMLQHMPVHVCRTCCNTCLYMCVGHVATHASTCVSDMGNQMLQRAYEGCWLPCKCDMDACSAPGDRLRLFALQLLVDWQWHATQYCYCTGFMSWSGRLSSQTGSQGSTIDVRQLLERGRDPWTPVTEWLHRCHLTNLYASRSDCLAQHGDMQLKRARAFWWL